MGFFQSFIGLFFHTRSHGFRPENVYAIRYFGLVIDQWAGHVARMEEGRSAFKILSGAPVRKIPLGRPRCRREDNIRMDLKEIGINTRNWVDLAEDRDYQRALVNVELNLRVS